MSLLLRIYSFAMWLGQPLLRRKLARRALAEPGYAEAVEERFGHYAQAAQRVDAARPLVWVHAVSLGETRAAAVLVSRLRSALPGMRLLLTHGTATGRAQGRALLQDGDLQVWQPWDTAGAVERFLHHFQPRVGLLMETEVWPLLVDRCARQGVPLCLVNARLSEKSLASALRLGWLSRPAYAGLQGVWAQTQADADRLAALGARVRGVTGNFKFDAQPDARQLAQGRAWQMAVPQGGGRALPVVLFASSREGEEGLWLQALLRLRQWRAEGRAHSAQAAGSAVPAVQWLVVPRHPQRFAEVAEMVRAAGLSVACRSDWTQAPTAADVWLGDSMGEMALYFGLAQVALLGGSFAPLGGQNLIEAAACGCPVITGPHTFNFEEAASGAVQADAAVRVADMEEAVRQALQLVADHPRLAQLQGNALRWSQQHRGAADRTVQGVLKTLTFPAAG